MGVGAVGDAGLRAAPLRQPSGEEEKCPMNISVVGIQDEAASEGVVICDTTISVL